MKGAIFDLDGVIVDTAVYHYKAWRSLAEDLGFVFTKEDNERLKGVSRSRSLEILLEIGGITATEKQKSEWAEEKNHRYVESLRSLSEKELLPGAFDYLKKLRTANIKTALGSASKNAPLILSRLHINEMFDAVVDGNSVSKAKPDPEVFIKAAELLRLSPADCTVFEDSQAGLDAAVSAGMSTVAIDKNGVLKKAGLYIKNLSDLLNDNLESMK